MPNTVSIAQWLGLNEGALQTLMAAAFWVGLVFAFGVGVESWIRGRASKSVRHGNIFVEFLIWFIVVLAILQLPLLRAEP